MNELWQNGIDSPYGLKEGSKCTLEYALDTYIDKLANEQRSSVYYDSNKVAFLTNTLFAYLGGKNCELCLYSLKERKLVAKSHSFLNNKYGFFCRMQCSPDGKLIAMRSE